MRPTNVQVMAHVGQHEADFKMGIDESAMAHIMNVLTDLYSDTALAIIREYSTNALDSNIEAGNPNPIEVTLPSPTSQQFVVKDNGLGLSIDEIRDVYAMYGNSTKRESDLVTGMLGLGCKSGLTYALQFTVDAVKNGLRSVAVVTKDDKGVGTIRVLDTLATTDPNGVTVTIPVKAHDVQSFKDKAYNFYSYWKPGTVLVNGEQPTHIYGVDTDKTLWVDEDVRITRTQYNTGGQNVMVMGNVPYPFKAPNFNHQITAWVPMGAVQFTPSREALMTTEATNEVVNELVAYVTERFTPALKKKLGTKATPWETMKVFHEWRWDVQRNPRHQDYNAGNIVVPKDRPLWLLKSWNDKAQRVENWLTYNTIQDTARVTIVTDYDRKSLIPSARYRLKQLLNDRGTPSGVDTVILCPAGMDLSPIDGRPNILTWQEVVDATEEPPKHLTEKVKRDATIYTCVVQGEVTQQTGEVDPAVGHATRPMRLVYAPVQQVPYVADSKLSRWSYHTAPKLLGERSMVYPNAMFVTITEGQIEKFKRIHPKAVDFVTYVKEEKEAALKALTETDKQHHHLHDGTPTSLFINDIQRAGKVVKSSRVRKALDLDASPAVARCVELGIKIPEPKKDLNQAVCEQYPLVEVIYDGGEHLHHEEALDDLIRYVDTKRRTRS